MALQIPAAVCADIVTVRIGHAAPTSGWLAAVGIENENAARLAIRALNQRDEQLQGHTLRFELVTVDDAGDAGRARDAAQALVDRGATAVVGHLLSGSTLAAAPVYAQAGVAQVSPSSSIGTYTRSGWPTAFRLTADDGRIGELLARHSVDQLELRRFVLIDDHSTWGRDLAADFALALRNAGGDVTGHLQVQESTTDLRVTVARLQALQPDAVFFAGFDRQAGLLLLQMRRQGLQARFVTGDAACTQDLVSFWAAGAAADDQVLCALPAGVQAQASPQMAQFVASYAQQHGARPEFYGAYTYDAVMLIGDAVRRAESASPAALRQALEQTHGYIGVTGPIEFDSRRDRVAPAVSLYTYRDEQRILLRTVR